MESCKGEKLSVFQPSFMIDSLLTRKGIESNGVEFPPPHLPLESVGKRRENGGIVHSNGRAPQSNGVSSVHTVPVCVYVDVFVWIDVIHLLGPCV